MITNDTLSHRYGKGFTLIELVMVILLLAVLGAVAIPNFIDFRSDAKNSTTKAGLGAMRAAVAIAQSAISLREATGVPTVPTTAEMQQNIFLAASHPVLGAAAVNIMSTAQTFPQNPWSVSTATNFSTVLDCGGQAQGTVQKSPNNNEGWCYDSTTGKVWANSSLNGATSTENNY